VGPDFNIFKSLLLSFAKDERITVWHMAIMFGILQLSKVDQTFNPIFISRKKVMELSHISSIVTYHKCIKELQEYGYIRYRPSYHPGIRSKIEIINLN